MGMTATALRAVEDKNASVNAMFGVTLNANAVDGFADCVNVQDNIFA